MSNGFDGPAILFEFAKLFTRNRISDIEDTADDAAENVRDLRIEIRSLSRRLDRLGLITQTLWELLREKTGLTDDQILATMQEIDRRNSLSSLAQGQTMFTCDSCGHEVNSICKSCIYCGTLAPSSATD